MFSMVRVFGHYVMMTVNEERVTPIQQSEGDAAKAAARAQAALPHLWRVDDRLHAQLHHPDQPLSLPRGYVQERTWGLFAWLIKGYTAVGTYIYTKTGY